MSIWNRRNQETGMLRASARELRDPRTLTLTALFVALQIVASLFTLSILPWLRVSFAFVFQAATGMLFGPVVAGAQGVAADIIGYLLRPDGPFFPGYTLMALLSGILYGCFFYRARVDWMRALCAKALVNLAINLGLGTLWAKVLYNQAFWAILPDRALKNTVMLVVEVPLLVMVYQILLRIQRQSRPR